MLYTGVVSSVLGALVCPSSGHLVECCMQMGPARRPGAAVKYRFGNENPHSTLLCPENPHSTLLCPGIPNNKYTTLSGVHMSCCTRVQQGNTARQKYKIRYGTRHQSEWWCLSCSTPSASPRSPGPSNFPVPRPLFSIASMTSSFSSLSSSSLPSLQSIAI